MKKPLSKLTRQHSTMHSRLSFGQKQQKLKARQTSLCNPPLRQVKEQNEIMRPTYHAPKAMQGLQYFHAKTKLGPCKIKRGRNLSCTLTAHTLTMHLGQISCKPSHVNYAKKKQKPTQWSLRHLSIKVPTHHAKNNLMQTMPPCHVSSPQTDASHQTNPCKQKVGPFSNLLIMPNHTRVHSSPCSCKGKLPCKIMVKQAKTT